MLRAIQRNVAFFGGLALTSWLCALAAPSMISPRGAIGPTILQSQSPFTAMIMVSACVLAAAVVAGIVGRITNTAIGVFVLGFGVFVLAGRTATIGELAFGSAGESARGSLSIVALECMLWALLALLAVWIIFLIAGPFRD